MPQHQPCLDDRCSHWLRIEGARPNEGSERIHCSTARHTEQSESSIFTASFARKRAKDPPGHTPAGKSLQCHITMLCRPGHGQWGLRMGKDWPSHSVAAVPLSLSPPWTISDFPPNAVAMLMTLVVPRVCASVVCKTTHLLRRSITDNLRHTRDGNRKGLVVVFFPSPALRPEPWIRRPQASSSQLSGARPQLNRRSVSFSSGAQVSPAKDRQGMEPRQVRWKWMALQPFKKIKK